MHALGDRFQQLEVHARIIAHALTSAGAATADYPYTTLTPNVGMWTPGAFAFEVVDLRHDDRGHLRVEEERPEAVEQALETIRNRVDQFGVSEPDIRNQGEKRILIKLPGIRDTKRAKELIGRTALLEFKLVDEQGSVEDALKGRVKTA